MVKIVETDIPDVKVIIPKKHEDVRGFLSETYRKDVIEERGLDSCFVQDNHSFSLNKGTIRGLHFQIFPCAQTKLVRVIRGSIFDVAIDIRPDSKYYKKYVSIILSDKNFKQLYIPSGFAHGFMALEKNTEVLYKVTNHYSKSHERGIIWDDPDIGIVWPLSNPILSDKDLSNSSLREFTKDAK